MGEEIKAPWFPLHSKTLSLAKKKLTHRDIVLLMELLEACWNDDTCSISSLKHEFMALFSEQPNDVRGILDGFFIEHPDMANRITNPYLFAEFHSKKKTRARKAQKTDPTDVSPLWKNCKYFRMSEAELSNAKRIYTKRGYPHEWLPLAISEVETWLGSESVQAIKCRAQPSHYRRLFAAWVIDNVTRALKGKAHVLQNPGIRKPNYFRAKNESPGELVGAGKLLTEILEASNERKKTNDGQ